MHKFCARAIIDNYIVQKISRCGAGSKEIFNDEVTTIVTDIIPDDIIIIFAHIQHPAARVIVRIVKLIHYIFQRRIHIIWTSICVCGGAIIYFIKLENSIF